MAPLMQGNYEKAWKCFVQRWPNEAIEKGLGLGGDSSVRSMKSVLEAVSKVSGVLC